MASYFTVDLEASYFLVDLEASYFVVDLEGSPPAPTPEEPPAHGGNPLAQPFRERQRPHPGARKIRFRSRIGLRSHWRQEQRLLSGAALGAHSHWRIEKTEPAPEPPPAPRPRPKPSPEARTVVFGSRIRVATSLRVGTRTDVSTRTTLKPRSSYRVERRDAAAEDVLALVLAGIL